MQMKVLIKTEIFCRQHFISFYRNHKPNHFNESLKQEKPVSKKAGLHLTKLVEQERDPNN